MKDEFHMLGARIADTCTPAATLTETETKRVTDTITALARLRKTPHRWPKITKFVAAACLPKGNYGWINHIPGKRIVGKVSFAAFKTSRP